MKSNMSKAQQLAARKHARHKQWQDDADKRLAESIRENANNKNIVRGKLGRGLRKWADRVLAKK